MCKMYFSAPGLLFLSEASQSMIILFHSTSINLLSSNHLRTSYIFFFAPWLYPSSQTITFRVTKWAMLRLYHVKYPQAFCSMIQENVLYGCHVSVYAFAAERYHEKLKFCAD